MKTVQDRQGWPSWPRSGGDERDGLRVLVVEGDGHGAASMATLLRSYGHEVWVARDGPTALQAAEDCPPDVVLLDGGLPGMAEYTVARGIGKQAGEKRPLLIAISGRGQEADCLHSTEDGIDLHLFQPVGPDQLQRLLSRFQAIIR